MKSPFPLLLFFCLFCAVLVALALFLFLSAREPDGAETAGEAVRRGTLPPLFEPPPAHTPIVRTRFTTHGSPHM